MKERQKEPSQQKNPRKWGMILLMAVLIIVMLVSLWNILGYLLEGRKSEKFAQDLQESAIIIEKDNTDSKDTKKEKEEKEEPIPDAIDFDTLHAISKDAVAWLYAPGGGINYVVAQAGDTTDIEDSVYTIPTTKEGRDELVKHVLQKSNFTSKASVTGEDKLVTLSTCTYEYEDARFVVIGKIAE